MTELSYAERQDLNALGRNGRPGRRADEHFSQADYNFAVETAARKERLERAENIKVSDEEVELSLKRACDWVRVGPHAAEISELAAKIRAAAPGEAVRIPDGTSYEIARAAMDMVAADRRPKTGTDRRSAILDQVRACVCRDRQNTYGDAEDNFADIAALATIVLGAKLKEPLESVDVASFSACIKLARIKTSPEHIDNWIDLAGYAVCGGGIVESKKGGES